MSEERRIVLWRRALFLFREFKETEGAFHKAGFTQFRVEQKIVGLNENKPDIIGWRTSLEENGDKALVLELTLNHTESKHKQLERYSRLEPSQLNPLGVSTKEYPDVILGIPVPSEIDMDFCHVILGETLSIEGIENLHDGRLRESLSHSEGEDLIHIPSTHFSIVPESKYMEIRRGIGPIILQMFAPSMEYFTAEGITDQALDFLREHMDSKVHNKMVADVRIQIEKLVDKYLKDYIEIKDEGIFQLTEKGMAVNKSPKSMDKVNRQINAWMYEKILDSYIEQFSEGSEQPPAV